MAKFVRRRFMRHANMKAISICVASSFVFLALCSSGAFAAAPVVDASGSTIKNIENRIKRLETRIQNQGLGDLINRVEQMQREMQQLVGQIEVQNHELKTLQEQQRKLYKDIDDRLRKLESARTTAPAQGGTSSGMSGNVPVAPATGLSQQTGQPGQQQVPVASRGGSSAPPPSPAQNAMSEVERSVARSAYERAFNLLKQGRYDLAIASFQAFLDSYPTAIYADNAQYWLGEANYAKKRYKVALSEFKKVLDNYPSSPKRADAMLKMGYTYGELGDGKKALNTLNTIVTQFPNTTAARLAQKRIKNLKSGR